MSDQLWVATRKGLLPYKRGARTWAPARGRALSR